MRKNFFYIGLTIIGFVVVLIAGCKKFLDDIEPPKSTIPSHTVFTSDATATSAVIGIYLNMLNSNSFASGSDQSITALAGLSADELRNLPRTDYDATEFELNSLRKENVYVQRLWKSLYKSIYEANAIIEGLNSSSGLTDKVKDQLMGEVLFVRAFCNFYIVNLFGDAPLITTTDFLINAKISRTPVEIIYAKIIEDLTASVELLAEEYVNRDPYFDDERVRPNKFTAIALLARVYLYQENWQKAEELSTLIIDNAALYNLIADLNKVFLMNSQEAIWQLSPVLPNFNTQEGYYFITNFDQYNVLREELVASFDSLDNRKTSWVGTSGILYFPYKYKQGTSPAATVTESSMVFRLAEQFLLRAEARAQQDKIMGAQADINSIRSRAGLANTAASDKESLLKAVEQERKMELFTEWGHRWFDLKRWGKANPALGLLKPGFTDNDLLYPIPQLELDKNTNLMPQNAGY
jgi:hypothetical protein